MLHFRNTYKNCKIMILYAVLAIISILIAGLSLLFVFVPKLKLLGILLCIIFSILFVVSFFLLVMKNNDYKLKYLFKLGKFNREFNKLKKVSKGNKKTLKAVYKQQKDYFLQYGEDWLSSNMLNPEQNKWNEWVEESCAFSYQNAGYMEKLSYLTYVLYNAYESGGGLEEFFRWISYEPFTKKELIEIISKNEFFDADFKTFIVKTIKEYTKAKQEKLFKRYELEDNKTFFTFGTQLFEYANWLAHNRVLLSSCVGLCLHGNIQFNMYRLFLSKDYQKVIYIYSEDEKLFKINCMQWDDYDTYWQGVDNDINISIFDSVDTAYKNIKEIVSDYIELEI